jgi:hypothetical protein
MNTEKLNSWLGVIANIGVLAGVIFLAHIDAVIAND